MCLYVSIYIYIYVCVCVCVNRLYLSDSASPLKTSTVGTYYRGPERALHRVFVSSSGYADQRTPLHVFRPQASVGGLLASPRRLCDVGTGPVRHDEADPRRTGMSPLRLEAWDLADVFASDVRRSEVELRIVAPPSPPSIGQIVSPSSSLPSGVWARLLRPTLVLRPILDDVMFRSPMARRPPPGSKTSCSCTVFWGETGAPDRSRRETGKFPK